MTRAAGLVFLLFAPVCCAQPQFRNAGGILTAETITNQVIESGERVRVSLALKNIGDQSASNLLATIRAESGISAPVPSAQSYGFIASWAPSQAHEFEFTANAPDNSLLLVNLDLTDSGQPLGTVVFRFRVGPQTALVQNSAPVIINDLQPAAPYPSIISVSNVPGPLIDVSVTLSKLSHTFPDDLDILLVSPNGNSVLLMSDACGTSDLDYMTLTFTHQSANVLPNQGLPIWSVVRPTNYVAGDPFPAPADGGSYTTDMLDFNGGTANGDWKLFILDDSPGDIGLLENGWSLNLTTLQQMNTIPTVSILGPTPNDTIKLSVTGRPHYSYVIETGPDPVQSSPLKAFIMPPSGSRTFEFPMEFASRYFRSATDP